MAERLQILLVHHRPELGGAPTSLSYLIREFDAAEFDVHVFCPDGPVVELFTAAGATVHTGSIAAFTHIWASTYHGRRWLLLARELMRLPKHVIDFRRVLRTHRFAVVHVNDSPLIVAGWLARRARLPIVWHLRSALPGEDEGLRTRLIRRAIGRMATASLAINEDVADSFGLGSHVIPNSVDLGEFRPAERGEGKQQLGLPQELPLLVYFGFLYPSKGFREFIVAARMIIDRGVDAQFLVVGGAVRGENFFRTFQGRLLRRLGLAREYDREARDLVDSLDLADRLSFVPFTRETARYYRGADVVVAPSRGPELGRPVIEAAASGVPIVTTGSVSGGGIVVPGKTGLLVEGWGIEQLTESLVSLLRDEPRRRTLGAEARQHALEHFDPAKNARRIESIYREVAGAGARTRILFVHHRPQLGGAPSSLAHLIRSLDSRFEAHVLVPSGPSAELFERAGATVHRGPVAMFAHAWDNPYSGLRWLVLGREALALTQHIRHMNELMRTYRFSIVHLNDSPLLPAAWAAHRHGARVVWHLRSALAGGGDDSRSRAIVSMLERWGDAAIAIDTDVSARFRTDLPLTIVPNSVEMPVVDLDPREAKRRLGLDPDRLTVGYAGFVRRQKGWPELVEAARILIDEGVLAQFVIMGGGVRPPEYFRTVRGRALELVNVLSDEESALRDRVARLGLDEQFVFLPFRADTSAVYPALDVVTFPNQGVGLGRPVLEAAAYGKPVIASGSAGGAGVLIPDVTGILLDDRSPTAIAAALRRLATEPETRQRMGEAAAEHARLTFDPERNARLVEAVYDSLLGRARPSERTARVHEPIRA